MKKIIVIQILLAVLILSCKKENEDNPCRGFEFEQASIFDDVEYEIINAVLESYFMDIDFIHINQRTNSPAHIQFSGDNFADENIHLDSLLLLDYLEKNENAHFFSGNGFSFNAVKLINPLEIDCFLSAEHEGWETYYTSYPKSSGIYTFYRPGINAAGNQAVLEYGWQGSFYSGMGSFLILEKENNKWVIKHRLYTWAS